jgi:hypothetical protein
VAAHFSQEDRERTRAMVRAIEAALGVANSPEFQQAFRCPAGAPMAPASRCRVW